MKILLMILVFLALPNVAFASTYKQRLERNHVKFVNEASNPVVYQYIYEVFKKIPKHKKVTIRFHSGFVPCGQAMSAAGCYNKNTIELMGDTGNEQAYKFLFSHEYAHRIGIRNECKADKFAQRFYSGLIYNC